MSLAQKEIIVIVGYGWVGQANALAFAETGYSVRYYDVVVPELRYADRYARRYDAIKPLRDVLEVDSPDTWYIVCVGDRVSPDGIQDISHIKKALESLSGAQGGVILRSTIIPESLSDLPFDYYVPEFLHEKKAVEECMKPQYFVLGRKGTITREPSFFPIWRRASTKTFEGSPAEASYIKYLSNIWNSLRIAFVNEFGNTMNLPETPAHVAHNERVLNFFFEEKSYLRYGRSFGGHCLPKDTRAFRRWYQDAGKDVSLIDGLCKANEYHMAVEARYPHLPEWFSEWVRPQIGGWAAIDALRASVKKRMFNFFEFKK